MEYTVFTLRKYLFIMYLVFAGEEAKPVEIQYTNDILAMISPENEKVSLGKVNLTHFKNCLCSFD